jgi:hypothetical protein
MKQCPQPRMLAILSLILMLFTAQCTYCADHILVGSVSQPADIKKKCFALLPLLIPAEYFTFHDALAYVYILLVA